MVAFRVTTIGVPFRTIITIYGNAWGQSFDKDNHNAKAQLRPIDLHIYCNYCEKLVYSIIHFKIINITKMAISNKVIGTPIKIGKLEVAQNDFPNPMSWDDAKKACAKLGDDWRLPTKDELNILFKNKVKIGGFSSNHYWSSNDGDEGLAWDQTFDDGYQDFADMNDDCNVRAVRA